MKTKIVTRTNVYVAIELLIGAFCSFSVAVALYLLVSAPSWFLLLFVLYIPGILLIREAVVDWRRGDEQVWVRRHLNWAYIIGLCFGGGLNQMESAVWSWIGVIILIVITVWVIKQKGRSLGTLFWVLLGILPLVVLCMKNKRDMKEAK